MMPLPPLPAARPLALPPPPPERFAAALAAARALVPPCPPPPDVVLRVVLRAPPPPPPPRTIPSRQVIPLPPLPGTNDTASPPAPPAPPPPPATRLALVAEETLFPPLKPPPVVAPPVWFETEDTAAPDPLGPSNPFETPAPPFAPVAVRLSPGPDSVLLLPSLPFVALPGPAAPPAPTTPA